MIRPKTNDIDLRLAVTSALLGAGIPRAAIRHEITLDSSSSDGRADMVVATDAALIGIEIKSGKDTLGRLEKQSERYFARFDRPCLVLDPIHERAVWQWGPAAAFADFGADGRVVLRKYSEFVKLWPWEDDRDRYRKQFMRPHAMLSMLCAWEVGRLGAAMVQEGIVPAGKRLDARCRIISHLHEHASIAQLRPRISAALRARALNRWEEAFWAKFDAQALTEAA